MCLSTTSIDALDPSFGVPSPQRCNNSSPGRPASHKSSVSFVANTVATVLYTLNQIYGYLVSSLQQRYRKARPVLRFVSYTLPTLLWDIALFLSAVVVMAPGCLYMAWFYWIASNRQTFRYGNESIRQRLDVYPSLRQQPAAPTLLYFYGGAWLIGYKLFGTLLARTLTAAGICVVIADYRNFPLASIPHQVDDVEAAVQWTLQHIHQHGGSASNLVVGGESAGGHLMLMAMLRRVLNLPRINDSGSITASNNKNNDWKPTDIKGFIAMATPMQLESLQSTFNKHKWDDSFVNAMFGGQLREHDPYTLLLQQQANDKLFSLKDQLPPVQIYHGTRDRTVPIHGAQVFAKEFIKAGAHVEFTIYPGWTHIQANIQGPMTGDYTFHRDVFHAVQTWTRTTTFNNERSPDKDVFDLQFPRQDSALLRAFCPKRLCEIATALMPF